MKMELTRGLALLIFLTLVITACSKKETTPPSPAETNGITLAGPTGSSKTWGINSFRQAQNGGSSQDVTSQIDACFVDNTFTFTNNSTQDYENDEGATKCNSTDPSAIEKGSWAFTEDGKSLLIDGTAYSQEYFLVALGKPLAISNLTATTFTATFSLTDTLNNTNVYTLGFAKK